MYTESDAVRQEFIKAHNRLPVDPGDLRDGILGAATVAVANMATRIGEAPGPEILVPSAIGGALGTAYSAVKRWFERRRLPLTLERAKARDELYNGIMPDLMSRTRFEGGMSDLTRAVHAEGILAGLGGFLGELDQIVESSVNDDPVTGDRSQTSKKVQDIHRLSSMLVDYKRLVEKYKKTLPPEAVFMGLLMSDYSSSPDGEKRLFDIAGEYADHFEKIMPTTEFGRSWRGFFGGEKEHPRLSRLWYDFLDDFKTVKDLQKICK